MDNLKLYDDVISWLEKNNVDYTIEERGAITEIELLKGDDDGRVELVFDNSSHPYRAPRGVLMATHAAAGSPFYVKIGDWGKWIEDFLRWAKNNNYHECNYYSCAQWGTWKFNEFDSNTSLFAFLKKILTMSGKLNESYRSSGRMLKEGFNWIRTVGDAIFNLKTDFSIDSNYSSEYEYPDIVPPVIMTEEGKKEWKDVLSLPIEKIKDPHYVHVDLEYLLKMGKISEDDAEEIEGRLYDFCRAAAGWCPIPKFELWFEDENLVDSIRPHGRTLKEDSEFPKKKYEIINEPPYCSAMLLLTTDDYDEALDLIKEYASKYSGVFKVRDAVTGKILKSEWNKRTWYDVSHDMS